MSISARPAKWRGWWLAFGLGLLITGAQAAMPVWRCGWYAQPPLQFNARQGEIDTVTGLDVQLIRAIAREAGRLVRLEEVPWDRQQAQLRSGECELAFGATWTAEREKFVRFSAPYRREENALYFHIRDLGRYKFKDAAGFLAMVRAEHLRLGVVIATAYLLPEVDAFVRDPANAPYLVVSDTDAENLQALLDNEVDAALTERLAAATISTQLGYDTELIEHPVPFGGMEVRAMFSRVSTTEADVEAFNRALHAVQASGEFDQILRGYLLPPLLGIAVGGRWFHWLDLIGTAAFALSGVILAHRGRYNLIGAFVLAALPAVGGGLLRDLITGRRPVGVLRSPVPLVLVACLVIAGYLFFKLADRASGKGGIVSRKTAGIFDALCNFLDTVGLAAFIITGVRVAVETQSEPLWLWGPLLAILTGAGGGVLRDIVRADAHNATLKRGFYAEVALVWGLIFSVFLEFQVRRLGIDQVRTGTMVVLGGAFVTRLVIQRRGWGNPFQFGNRQTLPERRLDTLEVAAGKLSAELGAWFEEQDGVTVPLALPEIERRHNAALRANAALQASLQELSVEPLQGDVATRVVEFRRHLDTLASVEATLYQLVREPEFTAGPARDLQSAVFVGAATICAACNGSDRQTLREITYARGTAIEAVRMRFASIPEIAAAERARLLQFVVRFERLVELLHDSAALPARAAVA